MSVTDLYTNQTVVHAILHAPDDNGGDTWLTRFKVKDQFVGLKFFIFAQKISNGFTMFTL